MIEKNSASDLLINVRLMNMTQVLSSRQIEIHKLPRSDLVSFAGQHTKIKFIIKKIKII